MVSDLFELVLWIDSNAESRDIVSWPNVFVAVSAPVAERFVRLRTK